MTLLISFDNMLKKKLKIIFKTHFSKFTLLNFLKNILLSAFHHFFNLLYCQ